MAQEQRIENRHDDKERKDPQTERKPIWTITGTAIAIQVFLIVLFLLGVHPQLRKRALYHRSGIH